MWCSHCGGTQKRPVLPAVIAGEYRPLPCAVMGGPPGVLTPRADRPFPSAVLLAGTAAGAQLVCVSPARRGQLARA